MAEIVRRVRPTPTDAYLGNPHKGCCTFQHFNGDELFPGLGWSEEGPLEFPPAKQPPAIDGYLPTTVSYCRWFWRVMEPEQGRYNFAMIDKALETAAARGQTVAVRLMAFGSARQPQAPDWYAAKHPMLERKHKSAVQLTPDHDAPQYLEHWGGFVREFARRYDADPRLETIDVTYIGPWGEGAGECSAEQCERFARLWKEAFANTPRLCMIGGEQMRAGIASGAGWRCDCYGDMKDPGTSHVRKDLCWNHMYESYPREVCEGGARETWKTAPVHFESCWVPMYWYNHGFDIDFILEQGLKYHGTYFMPKYTRLPGPWMEKLAAFCRRLGYRFVFRQSVHDRYGQAGKPWRFTCWIENVGVAPLYRRYDLALRFRQGDRDFHHVLEGVDPRTWTPGDVWVERHVPLPQGLKPGYAELAAGLVQPGTQEAKVAFAVKERFGDRWVDLGGVEVQ
ncbi:MAG: DUF4832 domain-containing protein [Planctomycetota bacterium]|nr:DUF4832 domain-containing protein [Planctomycetota bacterium]